MNIKEIETVKYNRSTPELEYHLLFAIAVAGKTAKQIDVALQRFFKITPFEVYGRPLPYPVTPFNFIKELINLKPIVGLTTTLEIHQEFGEYGELYYAIKRSKLGQHKKLCRAYKELVGANLDLKTCTATDLEKIHGIGKKTSRFFLMYNRENANHACLDTHVLKYLKEIGVENVPKATPTGKRYDKLEKIFLDHVKKLGTTPAELDFQIWSKYTKSLGDNNES